MEAFRRRLGADWEVTETAIPAEKLAEFADTALMNQPVHTFGLFDGRTRKLYQLRLKNLDILKPLEPRPQRRLAAAGRGHPAAVPAGRGDRPEILRRAKS